LNSDAANESLSFCITPVSFKALAPETT